MHGGFLQIVTAMSLLVAASTPALAQSADGDVEARAAAERTLDRGRRLMRIGVVGAGMSLAAMLMSDEQRAATGGTAMAVGGVSALGLGLIGDFAWYRGKTRLDALDRTAAGSLDGAARTEVEGALRQGRRLSLIGDIGVAMTLAAPFFPRHLCGSGPETCGPGAKAYILGAAAAVGVGIAGLIKTGRAESRLEAFDEMAQANHRVGVAPLRDGVTATYSVAW